MKNPIAVALGKLAKGKPKNFSPAEIEKRRKRMMAINRARKLSTQKPKRTKKEKI